MLSALGVVILYVASLIEVLDVALAVIASLLCVVAVIEYGKGAPWLVFSVTAVLSLVLLPQKSPAIMYAFFFGFYPILKEKYEKMKPVTAWICKEITFNVSLIPVYFAMKLLVMGSATFPIELYIITLVLCEAVFVLYDIALTRLISFYVFKLRQRFRFK